MFFNWYTWIVAGIFASLAIGSAIGHHTCRPISGTLLGLLGPIGWIAAYLYPDRRAMKEKQELEEKQRCVIEYNYQQYLKSQADQIAERHGVAPEHQQPSLPSEPPIVSSSSVPSPPVASSAPPPAPPASTKKRAVLRWRREESAR
jgi:hypothetical protein